MHGVHNLSRNHVTSARISVGNQANSLDSQLVQMYNHEFTERIAEDVPERSREDEHFLKFVENSIKHKDGHYEIGLPMKSSMQEVSYDDIPNNKLQAEQRVGHLRRKFQRDNNFFEEYKTFMKETIDNGYATLIPHEELEENEGRRWYLPHHGVRHPKKDKLRVVFDCSAKYKGFCLNSELLQGPNMTNTLIGVLMRFRQSSIAVVGDVQAMFHQVKVPHKDQDLLRFLWWRDGNIERPLEEYRMSVHLFGATSSPTCASFALKKAIEESKVTNGNQLAATMQRSFYVDDCLTSTETEKEAVTLVENIRAACQRGGFRLTKWLSNNKNVLYSIPADERAAEVRSLDLEDNSLPTERALGVLWSSENDTFGYQISLPNKPATRRGILSVVSSLYDPLGLVCPAILPAKRLLQDLCREKLEWDEEISTEHLRTWQEWLEQVPSLMNLQINRSIKPQEFGQPTSIELHHFSDASNHGYGTASYLRVINSEEEVHCTLMLGKACVAPLKKATIPRLELTAATVAVRVNNMLIKELDLLVDRTVFWTDSITVLCYIHNQSTRFHTFVANRLSVIHDGSDPSQWRYVNTKDNPADDASRGLTVRKFLQQDRWLKGPNFLWENDESSWPVDPRNVHEIPSDDDPEIKLKEVKVSCTVVKCEETVNKLLNYFHCWFKLKKVVAWLLRVKELLQKSKQQVEERIRASVTTHQPKRNENGDDEQNTEKDEHNTDNKEPQEQLQVNKPTVVNGGHTITPQLSVQDMQKAEAAIIGFIQKQAYPEEIEHLTKTRQADADTGRQQKYQGVKKSSSVRKLDPVYKDGLLRVGGRLSKAALPEDTKHPVILPKESNVTNLILNNIHLKTGHSGRNHMLAIAQKKYWIVKANSAARSIINKCVVCKRNRAKAGEQKMANLPESRLKPGEPPFTRVGIDYFSPIEVKRGRSIVKRYGVLFTCFTTRAVHIEKADSLDTDSCIQALRRFIARRGQVQEMTSDNGSNLVGAERELKKEIDKWNASKIHEEMLQKNIEWHFNPPAGSNFGGVWERHIRMVRKLMCSMLKEQTITDEGLQTLFCEIEAVMNSRPISRVSGDPNDLEALTPNHLLLMKSNPMLPPVLAEETGPHVKRRWKQIQYLAEIFWKRWLKEYLPMLQERQKWVNPKANLQVDDVVLIVDSSKPRNTWNLGRVVKTLPDKDGLIR